MHPAKAFCKRLARGSLRTRMLLAILALTAVEFILVFLMISTVYRDNNIEKSHEDNIRALRNIATELNLTREDVNAFMLDVHGDAAFMDGMISVVRGEAASEDAVQRQLRECLLQPLRQRVNLLSVGVRIAGNASFSALVNRSISMVEWSEFEGKYMAQVLREPGQILVYMPATANHLVFSRAQPILNGKQTLGYYCINVTLSSTRITQLLKQNMADASRQAFLLAGDGTIYNRTAAIFQGLTAADLDISFAEERGAGVCAGALGEWVYDVQYMDDVSLYVCVMTRMSSIDLTGRSFLDSVRIILIAMVCMATIIAVLVTRWINRPIRELTMQFGEILNDSPRKQLHIVGSGELQSVAEGINGVLAKQEILIRDNYRTKILEKNARIELLQVQINPHFVFNTLDIVNWFIYEKRNEEAGKVLVALGEMMRYSTYRYKSFVTLNEEIQQIRNYLYIQLIRYDYAFTAEIDAEEGLGDYKIPCLILQPIIENAVKYGASRKESGGLVSLHAVRGGDELVITVFDNGPGMTAEQIQRALSPEMDADAESAGGIGLRNVNQRMILLFGPAYAIALESEPDYYTQVTIRLPFKGETHEDHHR